MWVGGWVDGWVIFDPLRFSLFSCININKLYVQVGRINVFALLDMYYISTTFSEVFSLLRCLGWKERF